MKGGRRRRRRRRRKGAGTDEGRFSDWLHLIIHPSAAPIGNKLREPKIDEMLRKPVWPVRLCLPGVVFYFSPRVATGRDPA